MGLIFYLSAGPVTVRALNRVPDYCLHGLGYALMSVLAIWAVHDGLDPARKPGGYWLPILIAILYGISDEYHQSFVPARDASVTDLVSDAVGAFLGAGAVALGRRLVATLSLGLGS